MYFYEKIEVIINKKNFLFEILLFIIENYVIILTKCDTDRRHTMTPSEHAGNRIRMYRRKKKITLGELSVMVNKSPSTLSKYESGQIVIDIDSLFDIAQALGVQITQLIDYKAEDLSIPKAKGNENFFQSAPLYYAYVLFPSTRDEIHVCVFEITRDESEDRFVLYFDVDEIKNYTNSKYIYNGKLICNDSGASFYISNPFNSSDKGFIYAKSPFTANQVTTGIFTFVPRAIRNPCSTKIMFSLSPLEINENLRKELLISDKETISELKRRNQLIIF